MKKKTKPLNVDRDEDKQSPNLQLGQDATCMDDFDPDSLTINEANNQIRSKISARTETETVDLLDAYGRILASDLVSPIDVPACRNSSMDGYAFDSTKPGDGAYMTIVGTSLAGHPFSGDVIEGQCIRIMTGALVPDDLDTVVMQENTEICEGSGAQTSNTSREIRITKKPESGENIREIGSNIKIGSLLLPKATRLDASCIGLLASVGYSTVDVIRKLRIGCFSTGDELVAPGESPGPGDIHDANRYMLLSLLADPAIERVDMGIQKDSEQALQTCLDQTDHLDMIISSGGVSVGDADFVRQVISDKGDLNIWKVAMKPGRPLTHAVINTETHYFGLPGNPVSSIVTFHQFVKPAIDALLGRETDGPITLSATLKGSISKRPGRVELQRGILTRSGQGTWQVESTGFQDSHVLRSMTIANCYILLEMNSTGASDGEDVTILPFLNFPT